MKKLSGWEAARCDEHQFHAKLRVIAGAVLELLLFESMKSGLNKYKYWHFHHYTLSRLAVFHVA